METTRLSSKGQLILPKSVRDARCWLPGTEFEIEETPDGVLLRPLKPFAPTRLKDVIGSTGYAGPAKTVEEMDEAIRLAVKKRNGRGRY